MIVRNNKFYTHKVCIFAVLYLKLILILVYKTMIHMDKLQASNILIKDAKLSTDKLSGTTVVKQVDETKKKQMEVLKLKEVDQDRLRVVVQL